MLFIKQKWNTKCVIQAPDYSQAWDTLTVQLPTDIAAQK